jgi:hypothetical protein
MSNVGIPLELYYCYCENPEVDELGECQECHRKPWVLMGLTVEEARESIQRALAVRNIKRRRLGWHGNIGEWKQ